MTILVPTAWGEVIDKITILEIKTERITDPAKLENVRKELSALQAVVDTEVPADKTAEVAALKVDLKTINETLWQIEDDIRDCERAKDFGDTFIQLARGVYHTNDRRAAVKRQINGVLNSTLVEEKSYAAY